MKKYGTDDGPVLAFKALADPKRLQVLELLKARGESCCSLVGSDEAGLCACDLEDALGVSQSVVSHHMEALCRAGLVLREKRGRWMYYRRNEAALGRLAHAVAKEI
ncbi:MAG TPA: metalloregulator ArsR/SmtB family transcription factor [Thermoanaerobaculia bacterium]|jgi:ArsR family transcriptional regulator